jgi:hypothetical protein
VQGGAARRNGQGLDQGIETVRVHNEPLRRITMRPTEPEPAPTIPGTPSLSRFSN